MRTIHFKFSTSEDSQLILKEEERIFSSVVRYSYNRFKEGLKENEVRRDCIKKFKLGSFLIQSAVREAGSLHKLNKDKKVIFGDFKRYVKNLISKEELKTSRSRGFKSIGEANAKGNRYFKIDLVNSSILYKRNRKEHLVLKIEEKLSTKRLRLLETLFLAMVNETSPITFRVKGDKIFITYDEKIVEAHKRFSHLKSNRIMGIDLNPNYIGISILEFNSQDNFKVIHKSVCDISDLNELSPSKVNFEIEQINHFILKLCNHFKVSKLSVEDLKFKKPNKFWSKSLNRLCKNKFRYSKIKSHLNILCNVHGVTFTEVNAAYSTIVGNFAYGNETTPDMIASSIEIARRGYKKFTKKWFYPSLISEKRIREVLGNQWKKELELNFKTWKKLFEEIKKSKFKYRFQLNIMDAVLSRINYKSKVAFHSYL